MTQDLKDKINGIIHSHPEAADKETIRELKRIVQEEEAEAPLRTPRGIAALVTEQMERLLGEEQVPNLVQTGFAGFDRKFGGFGLGEFAVIGGRPSMGKTRLLVNLALRMSVDVPVLYVTYDLPEAMLAYRFVSAMSGTSMDDLLQRKLFDEEKSQLAAIGEAFGRHQLLVSDGGNYAIGALRAQCQQLIEEQGIKVIMVDYLQLMSSNRYRNSRELEISHISRVLKQMAKDFNVCVIAASQLSRAVESRPGGSRRPMLSDLRDSGAIEQDADKVIFLYRPEYYGLTEDEMGRPTAGLTEVILAKNRNGRLGTVRLLTDGNFSGYTDDDEDRYESYKTDFSFSPSRLSELEGDEPF